MAYHSTPMFTSVVDGLDYLIKALITDMSLVKALQLRCELSRIIYRTCSRNKNARQLLARIHTDRLRDSLQLCWSCVTFDNVRERGRRLCEMVYPHQIMPRTFPSDSRCGGCAAAYTTPTRDEWRSTASHRSVHCQSVTATVRARVGLAVHACGLVRAQ
jgi:hypothetical protein